VVEIQVVVFWVVTPCSVVVGYQLSEDLVASIFILRGVTIQKTST